MAYEADLNEVFDQYHRLVQHYIQKKENWFCVEGAPDAPAFVLHEYDDVISETRPGFHLPCAHGYNELFICVEGVCPLVIHDRTVHIHENECVLLLPETPHSEITPHPAVYKAVWIAFFGSVATMYVSYSGRSNVVYQFPSDSVFYMPLLSGIGREWHSRERFGRDLSRSMALQLLIRLSRDIDNSYACGNFRHNPEDIVRQVVRHIETAGEMTMKEISRRMAMDLSVLNGMFKTVTGRTILQYSIEQRISRAKLLLLDPNNKLSFIASALGFCDQYYLSKVFKKKTGLTPSAYRRKYTNFH